MAPHDLALPRTTALCHKSGLTGRVSWGTWLLRQVGWEDVRVKRKVGAEQETKVKGDSELGF